VFERANTVHALDRAATDVGYSHTEELMEQNLVGETNVFAENQPQCHFVQYNF
jgi:hypothetical protein